MTVSSTCPKLESSNFVARVSIERISIFNVRVSEHSVFRNASLLISNFRHLLVLDVDVRADELPHFQVSETRFSKFTFQRFNFRISMFGCSSVSNTRTSETRVFGFRVCEMSMFGVRCSKFRVIGVVIVRNSKCQIPAFRMFQVPICYIRVPSF